MSSGKSVSVLAPRYLETFHCIGSRCEEACCKGWAISVDVKALENYGKLKKTELSDLLEKSMEKPVTPVSDGFPGRIILDRDGACPLLDDANLCRIHRDLGAEFLPLVCATYPRSTNKIADTFERSASVSCPEVARIALLNPAPMEFDQDDKGSVDRDIIRYTLLDDAVEQLWLLRQFIFPLLQNRNFKIWERLILLGLFCRKISGNEHPVQSVVEEYGKMISSPEIKTELANIPVNISLQARLLTEIVLLRNTIDATSPTYNECFQSFLRGIHFSATLDPAELERNYRRAYVTYYQPAMESYEHVFENYFVNLAFKGVFPLADGNPVFDNYVKFALQYALIKVLLVGLAADEKGISEKSLIKFMFSFSKTIEHCDDFLDEILDKFRRQGMDGMPFIAILLKN